MSLFDVFATIPDPRSSHGLRYDLPFLLTCLVAAMLCNCDSTVAVAQWCREQRRLLARLFGPRRFLCPCDSLYRWLLPRLSAEHLEWALGRLGACHPGGRADDDPIALDGKTVRGASAAGHTAPHLLSFCTHQSQEILLHVLVSEKTNEIPVAQALLPCLPLAGRVCTADAMHTQTDFLERVDAQGGKTVLTVKKNQPTLYADLTTYFTDPLATYEQDSTCDYLRGRIERRTMKVSTAMNAYLSHWPHLAQVAQLTRTVTVRSANKTTEEVVYLITDLDPTAASPGTPALDY